MEDKLKEILTKPVMDQSMDQKIAVHLLNYDANLDKKNYKASWMRNGYLFTKNVLHYSILRIAIAVFVLAIVGVGTVLAAGFYVKSYPTEITIMKEEDIDFDKLKSSINNTIKKSFGTGNKRIGVLRDNNGNVLEIDEDGYYTFEDGSKFLAPFIPDPNRHENDRKSGDDAFAEIGYPNLVPTYIYENYLLEEGGFAYTEMTYEDNFTYKSIYAAFFTDAYNDTGDFDNEDISIQFNPSETSTNNAGIIYLENNDHKYNHSYSSYTTIHGILCSIDEDVDQKNVTVHISFDSETIGNGRIMLGFNRLEMDKIKEILDTIPLTEDMVNSNITE